MSGLDDYTEADILKMEEGSEMDSLIAVEVMGWTLDRLGDGSTFNGWYDFYSDHEGAFQAVEGDWSPSTSIENAYEAEEAVPEEERQAYGEALSDIVCANDGTCEEDEWRLAHASPLDRCRALLIWKKRRMG